jgi:hypothetical protein
MAPMKKTGGRLFLRFSQAALLCSLAILLALTLSSELREKAR